MPLNDVEKVEQIVSKLRIDLHWLFRQAYFYTEEPEEEWFISWKVRQFIEHGEIPVPVIHLVDRIYADHPEFF